jgi:glyoxalase superfamily protein
MSAALEAVTFDCTDALRLVRFWSAVLDHPIDDDASEAFASIGLAGDNKLRPAWMFVKVPEAKAAKNRFHPDLTASNQPTEVDRIIGLGAQRLGDFDEGGTRWTTLTDPEGNEFDIVAL